MAYTALELITRSYYLSQIVARGLQTVSGEQVTDGLFILNRLLDYKSTDIRLIPYYKEHLFNTVQGTEMYFIQDLVTVDSLTFNLDSVRYPLIEKTRDQYFSGPRIDNVQSLPNQYRIERCFEGSNVYLYFVPNQVYQMKLWGKFSLPEVTLTTDLSLIFDQYFIEYLRYSLGAALSEEWGNTFPDQSKMKLDAMQKKMMDVSPPDLSIAKASYFGRGQVLDYQQINIGLGWTPYM